MIHFITGGARSGKSSYAQNCALELDTNPVYVATAKIWDKEFEQRVKRHQADRTEEWTNYEETLYLSTLPLNGKTVVIDCVTLWLTNFFLHHEQDIECCLKEFKKEIDQLLNYQGNIFIVSNEIGMGVHAETEVGRKFTDLQGFANQYVASKATSVTLMVSGIPMKIKGQ